MENVVVAGDCLEVMAGLERESVDAIVTDPPYDLTSTGARKGSPRSNDGTGPYARLDRGGFMGKRWDGTGIAFRRETWEAAYRVAKPSAYLLAFGGTRTVHRMTVAIEDAGWIIRDMLVWAYASGFPKSKASLKPAWEPIVMARKPGPLRMLAIDECRIPFESSLDAAAAAAAAMRLTTPRVGAAGIMDTLKGPQAAASLPAYLASQERGRWPANVILTDPIFDGDVEGVVGGGAQASPDSYVRGVRPERFDDTAYSLPVPEMVNAYGDSGTYSRFFTIPDGGTMCEWCGASRAEASSRQRSGPGVSVPGPAPTEASSAGTITTASPTTNATEQTSWHGESASTSRNEASPASRLVVPSRSARARSAAPSRTSSGITMTTGGRWMCDSCADDAMRFSMAEQEFAERNYPWAFLIPKADRTDREPVLGGPTKVRAILGQGIGGADNLGVKRANHHPTVKPTELMRHLVRLVTPSGGLVLDPFLGSGTTAIAAELEGFRWLGIEKEAEYVAIAEARLNGTQRGMGLAG